MRLWAFVKWAYVNRVQLRDHFVMLEQRDREVAAIIRLSSLDSPLPQFDPKDYDCRGYFAAALPGPK